jgi:hypothetical protein
LSIIALTPLNELNPLRSPKVSVLLVVRNALPLLTGALQSLKDQTFKEFEVIVADGASTDGTLAVLERAANELPLRIVSRWDESFADAVTKAAPHVTGDIVGVFSADERYNPNTLEQVLKWFEAQPSAAMCGGKVDFIDERDNVIGNHLTAPFDLSAHLACELVPSILSSFFNRSLIGDDFRFDAKLPTCPDYEFWARLGFRFPASAFKRYDLSIARAYRTGASGSFRAENFRQYCYDKLARLNDLLQTEYSGTDVEALWRRASAGIHMWAAEQLSDIEPGHSDILAHCAAAAAYDRSYTRIARFLSGFDEVWYDAATGAVKLNLPGPQTTTVAQFECRVPPPYWAGAIIIEDKPLTVRTADAPWGFSLELSVPNPENIPEFSGGGQYWARFDLEVVKGSVGISLITPDQELHSERIFAPTIGRTVAFIPLPSDVKPATPVMIRSGGHPFSVLRVYHAELLYAADAKGVAAIDLGHRRLPGVPKLRAINSTAALE